MALKTDVSLQTKQVLSQTQVESLAVLSMPVTELREFLQKEEIENPIAEYSSSIQESGLPVTYREYGGRIGGAASGGGSEKERDAREFFRAEDEGRPVDELVISQLPWKRLDADRRRIVDFCIHSLDGNGYLAMTVPEIAEAVGLPAELTADVVADLKELEPAGIFASGLEECLLSQIAGLDGEEKLAEIIRYHLADVAEGKLSSISRALKVSSAEVRRLIQELKTLNPRPLNGYGREEAQYVVPDVLLGFSDGQWTVSLNDKWAGTFGVNAFYVHMMETAQDEELKQYFEEKLKRARFIINAVEQRRQTLEAISGAIIRRQGGYLLGKEPLKPMTLDEIAGDVGIHKSTVSRAIREKYLVAPAGCLLFKSLFTSGLGAGDGKDGDVSRNTVKERLKRLIEQENKAEPRSDEELARLLKAEGMGVSRRTVAKYRMEMGIGSVFQRRG